MKKLQTIFSLLTLIGWSNIANGQLITGVETGAVKHPVTIRDSNSWQGVTKTNDFVFSFTPFDIFSGFDVQSNASPNQIWLNPEDPSIVHIVYMQSQQTSGWTDRKSIHLVYSSGIWVNTGPISIDTSIRTGFPYICGLPDGRPMVAHHSNDGGGVVRSQLYIGNDLLGQSWTKYDPGVSLSPNGDLWPRISGLSNNRIAMVVGDNSPSNIIFNSFDFNTSLFSGYNNFANFRTAEAYNIVTSESGNKIGMCGLGDFAPWIFGDVWYKESYDGGISYPYSAKAYDFELVGDSIGSFLGVDNIFIGEVPFVVFELTKLNDELAYGSSKYYNQSAKIGFWSPGLNNGDYQIIASNFEGGNIPFYNQYWASQDRFLTLSRPSIGRSSTGGALFVAFSVTTNQYLGEPTGVGANTYFAGYFMASFDSGSTWTNPVKFTPDSPLRDWRYVSIAPVNYVDGNICKVNMVIQCDSIPGSTANAPAGYPAGITAQPYYVTTEIELPPPVSVEESSLSIITESICQNLPNPFNHITYINYQLISVRL